MLFRFNLAQTGRSAFFESPQSTDDQLMNFHAYMQIERNKGGHRLNIVSPPFYVVYIWSHKNHGVTQTSLVPSHKQMGQVRTRIYMGETHLIPFLLNGFFKNRNPAYLLKGNSSGQVFLNKKKKNCLFLFSVSIKGNFQYIKQTIIKEKKKTYLLDQYYFLEKFPLFIFFEKKR